MPGDDTTGRGNGAAPVTSGAVMRWGTLLLVAGFVLVGSLYAAFTPAWQVPDEPAHYNYIRQIAETGRLPVIELGDYDQDYLSRLTSKRFPPELPLDAVQYEDHQPPLYYLLQVPVFLLSGGALLPLRLLSVAMGAVVVWASARALAAVFPGRPWLVLAAAAVVAFVPQHVAMLAGVNNDALADLWLVLGLWQLFVVMRETDGPEIQWARVGVFIGLAFVTKTTVYLLAPVALAGLILQMKTEKWKVREFAVRFFWLSAPALPFALAWWSRNVWVYGWPDFFGLIAHDAVVVGQPRTSEWVAQFGAAEVLRRLVVTTFRSFWGQFGWMGVPMPGRVYDGLLAFSVAVLAGLGLRAWQRPRLSVRQWEALAVLAVLAFFAGGLFAFYNAGFVQHQGRYLFPALLTFAVLVVGGLSGWLSLAERVAKRHLPRWLLLAGVAWLPLLCMWALFRYIVPSLS